MATIALPAARIRLRILVAHWTDSGAGTARSYRSPEISTASTLCSVARSATAPSTASWSASRLRPWKVRPRCQSEVCSRRMGTRYERGPTVPGSNARSVRWNRDGTARACVRARRGPGIGRRTPNSRRVHVATEQPGVVFVHPRAGDVDELRTWGQFGGFSDLTNAGAFFARPHPPTAPAHCTLSRESLPWTLQT